MEKQADLVIWGDHSYARALAVCLQHDSPWRPVAFTVDQDYMRRDTLGDLPVLPFESLAERYPPDAVGMIIGAGAGRVNRIRTDLYHRALDAGYSLRSWVSSRASVWPDLVRGDHCVIFDHAIVQPGVTLGANVIVRSGAHVSHDDVVGDHAYIAPRAALAGEVRIGARCFIGVNSTIRDGVQVADDCLIAAGAVVVRDTEAGGVYAGVPARRVGETTDHR